jgi:hypothetical protein
LPVLKCTNLYGDISAPHSFMDESSLNAFICFSYMGFKKIYFIGCDLTTNKNGYLNHFYKNDMELQDSKNTYKDKYKEFNLKTEFSKWHKLERFVEKNGVKLLNAGLEGKNTVCDRVGYKSLFK